MRKGQIVRFKEFVDAGDKELRMVVLEDEDGGRVLVEALAGMNLNPTYRYNKLELEICEQAHIGH